MPRSRDCSCSRCNKRAAWWSCLQSALRKVFLKQFFFEEHSAWLSQCLTNKTLVDHGVLPASHPSGWKWYIITNIKTVEPTFNCYWCILVSISKTQTSSSGRILSLFAPLKYVLIVTHDFWAQKWARIKPYWSCCSHLHYQPACM